MKRDDFTPVAGFTSQQIALLTNTFNFCLVALGLHSKFPMGSPEREQSMETALNAMQTYPSEVWSATFQTFKSFEKFLEKDTGLTATNFRGEPQFDTPTVSRRWDDLTQEEKNEFMDYEIKHGFMNEHDPRDQDN